MALGLPARLFLLSSNGCWLALVGTLMGLIMMELLKTAIDRLSDRVTPEHSRAVKIVKNVGSAAVFVTLCLAFYPVRRARGGWRAGAPGVWDRVNHSGA